MNRIKRILILIITCAGLSIAPTTKSQAQIEAVLEAIKAAIKALDIQVQRLQNYTIGLQNIQKEVENELSKLKLDEISDWTQKQKDLYSEYFDELWKVKNVISYYKGISDIIQKQKDLVAEYKQAYRLTQQDSHFSAGELAYISDVYNGIVNASIDNINQILTVLQAFTVQMSDGERLKIINHCAADIEQQITDLRKFNYQNILMSLQRAKDLNDLNIVKNLYGIKN